MVPTMCVIHYTASGEGVAGDIAWFEDPRSDVSAHFVIARDGSITQMVPLDKAAWHARGYNAMTIGIELDNLGPLDELPNGNIVARGTTRLYTGPAPIRATLAYNNGRRIDALWEPYRELQLQALEHLLDVLKTSGYEVAAGDLIGHEELSPERKSDPGAVFPWERFARIQARGTRRL